MEFIQKWWQVALIVICALLFASPIKASDYFIHAVNYQRSLYKLTPLVENNYLDISAQIKACDLRDRNYWSHKSPNGTQPWDISDAVGYPRDWMGENLAKDCKDSYCMTLFMKSKTHRDNILFSEYRDIGIGRCGTFKVIHFGSQR